MKNHKQKAIKSNKFLKIRIKHRLSNAFWHYQLAVKYAPYQRYSLFFLTFFKQNTLSVKENCFRFFLSLVFCKLFFSIFCNFLVRDTYFLHTFAKKCDFAKLDIHPKIVKPGNLQSFTYTQKCWHKKEISWVFFSFFFTFFLLGELFGMVFDVRPWRLFNSILLIMKSPLLAFHDLIQRHGPVIRISMGGQHAVLLGGRV